MAAGGDDPHEMLDDLERKLSEAAKVIKALRKSIGKNQVKHPNGRLTDLGVRKLQAMIDAGTPDSEIARRLGVTQSAVYHQRQRYLAENGRSKHPSRMNAARR